MSDERLPQPRAKAFVAVLARAGTVRVRLTLAVTLLFAVALATGATALVRITRERVLHAMKTGDREQLEQLRAQIEGGVPMDGLRVEAQPGRTIFQIRRPDGTVIQSSSDGVPPPFNGPPPPPPPFVALELPPPPFVPLGFGMAPPPGVPCPELRPTPTFARSAGDWSVLEMPSISPEAGPLQLLAASPVDDVQQSIETLNSVLWVATPFLLVLIAAAAWLITGRALSPVLAMTRTVRRISTATLHERLPEPGTGDEIAALARTLNDMLTRLDVAARRQREFVSDASHELRSPIASLRAQLEVALAHPARAEWPAVAQSALAESLRLEALVADLLLLARLDERTDRPQAEVDVDDIVLDEVRRRRRVIVDATRVGAGRVRGDAGHLAQVARNLLDNAARHARTRVEVSLTRRGNQIILAVDDDGPGVPEAERERVFERFTRLEEARSRDAGGVGLGLALVRRVAERHGGSAILRDSKLGGVRAEVRLPAALPLGT